MKLIVALSTVDSCFAAVCLVEYSLRKGFNWITWTPFYMTIWPVFILPMQNITYSMSLFVTLAIAIERYYKNKHFLMNIKLTNFSFYCYICFIYFIIGIWQYVIPFL